MPDQGELHPGDRNSLCGLITVVYQFADVAYQRRIWVEGKGPDVSSYSEALSDLFDAYRIEDFANGQASDLGLSENAVKSLSTFLNVLDNFDTLVPEGLSGAEVVRREGWAAVVAAAGRVLDSGALDWLDNNCGAFPMFLRHWRGRAFGGTWKEQE
jgi:hypothetical protein